MKINNSSLREHYLQTNWERYPDAVSMKLTGRFQKANRLHVTIFQIKASRPKEIKIPAKGIKNWPELKLVLIPGDILGFQQNGECVLLAPYLSEEPVDYKAIAQKIDQQYSWNRFMASVAAFFNSRGFMSVNTPSLVDNPGPEPTIDVFKTDFKTGRASMVKYLITSPELHLKKIISETMAPVFEVTKVFRNNEHSLKHQPEFWMIEWYRPFATLEDISKDVKELILYLIKNLKIKTKIPRFESTSYKDILKETYGLDFRPDTSADQIKEWLKKEDIYFSPLIGLDDLFTLLNIEMIEKKLNGKNVVFLNDYPPYAAALAKINKAGWAQRFEVYWKDLELGNAFYELNDPDAQQKRMQNDNDKKIANGLEGLPEDKEFMESLKKGLPPTAGIALGLERLYMALYGESDIKNLKWFAH